MTDDGLPAGASLERVIDAIEQADFGSKLLDIMIATAVGAGSSKFSRLVNVLMDEGYSWDTMQEIFDEEVKPYSRSLDAAVPGESIVMVAHAPKRARWAALHRTMDGREVLAWAATEVLARRLAGLKALQAGRNRAPSPGVPAGTSSAVPAAPSAAAPEPPLEPGPLLAAVPGGRAGDPSPDWKIRF